MRPNLLRTWMSLRTGPRDREALERLQLAHLQRLLAHAYDRVPYYRRLLDEARVHPRDIRQLADLQHVPETTRETLQGLEPSDLLARGYSPARMTIDRTSGSSGRPLSIYRSRLDVRLLQRVWRRTEWWLGRRPKDRMALVKALVTKPAGLPTGAKTWRQRLFPPSGVVFDAGLSAEELTREVEEAGVRVLFAYPPVLAVMAQEIEPSRLRGLGLLHILAGGEVLYPHQRKQIENAFGVRIYECYASTELDLIGLQCPHGSTAETPLHHLMEDSVFVEVDPSTELGSAADDVGELIGTCLHAWAMPIIRYRQGDVVERVRTECPCGTPMHSLRTIQGRILDMFVRPDGRWIHPYDIFVPIRDRFRSIRRFEATQRSHDDVLLRMELAEPLSEAELRELRRMFADRLAPEVGLEIEVVDGFDAPPGKFKQYHSRVGKQPGHA